MAFEAPCRLENEVNKHEHWRVAHERATAQRREVAIALLLFGRYRPALPLRVEITNVRPKALDSDGLVISAKWVRDAIARWLGVDDGPRVAIQWVVLPEKAPAGLYGVRVAIFQDESAENSVTERSPTQ